MSVAGSRLQPERLGLGIKRGASARSVQEVVDQSHPRVSGGDERPRVRRRDAQKHAPIIRIPKGNNPVALARLRLETGEDARAAAIGRSDLTTAGAVE